jgi:hypothetical protein
LDFDLSANPARRQAVVSPLHFDAAIEMHDPLAV